MKKFQTIFITVVISVFATSVGAYLWLRSAGSISDNIEKKSESVSQTHSLNEVRELFPRGYIIGDKLFYSPIGGLLFTGALKDLQFKDNVFTVPERPGIIQIFTKKAGENVIDAMKELARNEGANPDDCDFDVLEASGTATVSVKPKKPYEPTEKELFSIAKKENPDIKTMREYRTHCDTTPECDWMKNSLIQKNTVKVCSKYAISNAYHDESFFKYVAQGAGSDTFIYVHFGVGGGDSSWIDHTDLLAKDNNAAQ